MKPKKNKYDITPYLTVLYDLRGADKLTKDERKSLDFILNDHCGLLRFLLDKGYSYPEYQRSVNKCPR